MSDDGLDMFHRFHQRLLDKIDDFQGDRSALRRLLIRVANRLEHEARLSARDKGVMDTGELIKSITARVHGKEPEFSIEVGTPGLIYGRFQHSGKTNVDARQRAAIFARLREEGKDGKPGKGLLRGSVYWGRPFIRDKTNPNNPFDRAAERLKLGLIDLARSI